MKSTVAYMPIFHKGDHILCTYAVVDWLYKHIAIHVSNITYYDAKTPIVP